MDVELKANERARLSDWSNRRRQELVADYFATVLDQMQFRTLEDVMADPLRVDVPPRYRGQVE